MSEFLLMCIEFFKTGLFSVGGGLATLPFLTDIAHARPEWFTIADLADIVAVAESTPGPMGVNMSTFAGFKTFGVLGGICTTLSLVLPSFLVVLVVSRIWERYKTNEKVIKIFTALRATAIGLIISAGVGVFISAVFPSFAGSLSSVFTEGNIIDSLNSLILAMELKPLILFAVMMIATQIKQLKNLHPVIFIALAAVVGIIFKF